LFSGIINITKFRIFITLMYLMLEDSNIELDFWFPQRWNFTLPKLAVGKDGEKSRKRPSSDGSEKMERVGDRKKMAHYSTGQSPQRAVAPKEDEVNW
jgi:hypothetical protein